MPTIQNSPYSDLHAEIKEEARPRCAEPDVDPNIFDPRTQSDFDEAVRICGLCPKRIDCRREAVEGKESGIWGGAFLDQGRQRRPAFKKIGVRSSKGGVAKPVSVVIPEATASAMPESTGPLGRVRTQDEFAELMGRQIAS